MGIRTEMLYWKGYIRYAEALVLDQKPGLALDMYDRGLKKVSSEEVWHLVGLFLCEQLRELLSLIVPDVGTKTRRLCQCKEPKPIRRPSSGNRLYDTRLLLLQRTCVRLLCPHKATLPC